MSDDTGKKQQPPPPPPPAKRGSRLKESSPVRKPSAPSAPTAAAVIEPGAHRHMTTANYGPPADELIDPTPAKKALFNSTAPGVPTKTSLDQVIQHSELQGDAAVDLFCRICDVVQTIHAQSKHHGVLTPRHIVVLSDGSGEVQLLEPATVSADPVYDVHYEAPEASGKLNVRRRNPIVEDVYALGSIGFELFTGRPPFEGLNPPEIRDRRVKYPVPAARQVVADVDIAPAVELQLQKALKIRVAERHKDAAALAAAMRHANATDDRETVLGLPDDQAALLKQMLAARSAEADAELAEERRKLQQERREAQSARKRAETARLEAERSISQVALNIPPPPSKMPMVWLGVTTALLIGGGILWWTTASTGASGEPSADVAPVATPDVQTSADTSAAAIQPDTHAESIDSGGVEDSGQDTEDVQADTADLTVAVDTKQPAKAKPRKKKSRHKATKRAPRKPKKKKPINNGPVVF